MGAAYLALTALLALAAPRFPRGPVHDPPDWGACEDIRIPAQDNGFLEAWIVRPAGPERGVAVFAHGWGRNRDRMTPRARVFGQMGFTCVMASARDHGASSPHARMNVARFAEDIRAVVAWVNKPVLLYGHSAGAAGAILATAQDGQNVRMLFLEGCYVSTRKALLRLYWDFHPLAGIFLGPPIVFWTDVFSGFGLEKISPARLCAGIAAPVLVIHGACDKKFPARWARALQQCFPAGQAELFLAQGAGHSGSPASPGYAGAVASFLEART